MTLPVRHCLLVRRGHGALRRPPRRGAPAGAGAVPAAGWRRICRRCRPSQESEQRARGGSARRRSAGTAAIAAEAAATAYGPARPRAAASRTRPGNATRFLVLGRAGQRARPSGDDKTSLVLSVRDEVGVLARMLRPFATHRHRPDQDRVATAAGAAVGVLLLPRPEGASPEPRVARALAAVGGARCGSKILGSYPAAPDPERVMTVDIRHARPRVDPHAHAVSARACRSRSSSASSASQGSIKLASNENPLGPSPRAVAADAAALDGLHRYPDGSAFYLRAPARRASSACRRTRSSSATARTRSSSWSRGPSSVRATRR